MNVWFFKFNELIDNAALLAVLTLPTGTTSAGCLLVGVYIDIFYRYISHFILFLVVKTKS